MEYLGCCQAPGCISVAFSTFKITFNYVKETSRCLIADSNSGSRKAISSYEVLLRLSLGVFQPGNLSFRGWFILGFGRHPSTRRGLWESQVVFSWRRLWNRVRCARGLLGSVLGIHSCAKENREGSRMGRGRSWTLIQTTTALANPWDALEKGYDLGGGSCLQLRQSLKGSILVHASIPGAILCGRSWGISRWRPLCEGTIKLTAMGKNGKRWPLNSDLPRSKINLFSLNRYTVHTWRVKNCSNYQLIILKFDFQ